MGLLVLIACAVIVWRRRRNGTTAVVPIAISAVAAVLVVDWLVAVAEAWRIVDALQEGDKATVLAAWISEGINMFAFQALVVVPVAAVAFFVDRALRRRQSSRRS